MTASTIAPRHGADRLAVAGSPSRPSWTTRIGSLTRSTVSWAREAGRESRGHLIWITIWSVIGLAATVASPLLLDHPALLMALSPRTVFLGMGASHTSLLPFVLIGLVRLSVTDASYFIVGRRLSQRCGTDAPPPERGRAVRLAKALCRNRPMAATVLFLRPNSKYLGVAGANTVSGTLAGIAAVAGTIAYLVALHAGVGLVF